MIWLAIALAVVGCLLIVAAPQTQREREANEARSALAGVRSDLARSEERRREVLMSNGDLAAAYFDLADELAATQLARDEWQRRYGRLLDDMTEMRMRGRVLPDVADSLDLLLFDDGGTSPIFDSMPVGLFAPAVAVIGVRA